MMNHWGPGSLGKSDELFDFLKPKPKGGSVYDVFSPKASVPGPSAKSRDFYDYFKPAHKKIEQASFPSDGGDPFAAAAAAPRGKVSFRARPGGEAWKPYPRMREGYQAPAVLSGPGSKDSMSFLGNPALWLIAGTAVLIALEVNGVTNLSSNA